MNIHLSLLLSLAMTTGAMAQSAKKPTNARDAIKSEADSLKDTAPVVAEPSAPYDIKMLRLAEVLGSIHYLRTLCGANERSKWRNAMGELIDAENPGPKRKARLIARFNRGYTAFDGTYSTCTQSALYAADRYRKEGVMLSSQITTRYGR